MADYNVYYVNWAGHIAGVQSVEASTDEEAFRAARRLLMETKYLQVEVWDLQGRIGVIEAESGLIGILPGKTPFPPRAIRT